MAEKTKIEWCDRTWSPWVGCSPVSPGCDHCYARGIQRRFKQYGPGGSNYRLTADSGWAKVLRWDAAAERAGQRATVFPSMCDPFDPGVPNGWRMRFFSLVADTPNLVWLLLTKRPHQASFNFRWFPQLRRANAEHENIWVGVTVEDQARADARIPELLKVHVARTFLSMEPLLGPVVIPSLKLQAVDWVIVGGETGPGWRPMYVRWAVDLHEACQVNGVPFFFKQWAGKRQPRGCMPFSCEALESAKAFPEDLR